MSTGHGKILTVEEHLESSFGYDLDDIFEDIAWRGYAMYKDDLRRTRGESVCMLTQREWVLTHLFTVLRSKYPVSDTSKWGRIVFACIRRSCEIA